MDRIGAALEVELGNVVHGRADIDGGAVIEQRALLAAFT